MIDYPSTISNQHKELFRRQRNSRSKKMVHGLPSIVIALLCLLLATISSAQAQAVGEDICACSPSTYEFTFNFALTCPRPGGEDGPGIAEVTCFVTSFSADVEDLTPVAVQTISIIEADIDRVPIAQSAIDGEFEDGSTFTYSSVSALGNSSQIPQSIQLTITGINAEGDSLVQVWAIKFTNDCGVFPVLEMGESFGWTEFTDLGTPRNEVCPVAPETPTAPVAAPTDSPEELPVITTSPTPEPTVMPEVTPSPTMQDKKTPEPTVVDTSAPTLVPTLAPSPQPTTKGTEPAPTKDKDTKAPTPKDGGKGDDDDTDSPTPEPSIRPATKAPVTAETSIPTEESEPTSSDMSFSYSFDEDFDSMDEEEWGRGSKKKKDKDDEDKDGGRGKVRIGQRRYNY